MIPTQPGLPIPQWPDNNPFNRGGYTCPSCGQLVGDMQYHACSGITPRPLGTGTIETLDFNSGGMMSDFMMYADFKKLMRNDTLAKFRERFLAGLLDLEQNTPVESGDSGLAIDAIMDIFDNVAKGINYNTDL